MKKIIIASIIFSSLFSCKDTPAEKETDPVTIAVDSTAATKERAVADDQAAIAATVHEFYKWYDVFQKDEKRNINYIDDSGKYRILDETLLNTYYDVLKSSGYLSDEFIAADRNLMKACAKVWIDEGKEGPPSCMDEDRFFCSQDWLIDFYTKAPVTIQKKDGDRVTAMLKETKNDFTSEQKLDLKKENGKWMITKIYCIDAPM